MAITHFCACVRACVRAGLLKLKGEAQVESLLASEKRRLDTYKRKIDQSELEMIKPRFSVNVDAANRFIDAALTDLPRSAKTQLRKLKESGGSSSSSNNNNKNNSTGTRPMQKRKRREN